MKKKNLVVVAFLLVAAMTIGVGYAALTANLEINGTAKFDRTQASEDFSSLVYFSNAELLTDATNPGTGSEKDDENANDVKLEAGTNSISFAVNSLIIPNETVSFKYTITNASDVGVIINEGQAPEIVSGSNNVADVYKVETSWSNYTNYCIDPGSSVTVTVKVTLIGYPPQGTDTVNNEYTIAFDAVTQTQQ